VEARHSPPHQTTSAPIPLTNSQRGTRTHGHQVTQHGLQVLPMPCVFGSVWEVFVGDSGTPCACFAGSPHTASSATPWAALRADTKCQALAWQSLCTPAYTHMLTHMEWPVMHSPISPFDVLQGPLVLQPAHVHSRARTLQWVTYPRCPAVLHTPLSLFSTAWHMAQCLPSRGLMITHRMMPCWACPPPHAQWSRMSANPPPTHTREHTLACWCRVPCTDTCVCG